MQVGFTMVLKKLRGDDYPGILVADSPGEAFDKHCFMWEATETGRNM